MAKLTRAAALREYTREVKVRAYGLIRQGEATSSIVSSTGLSARQVAALRAHVTMKDKRAAIWQAAMTTAASAPRPVGNLLPLRAVKLTPAEEVERAQTTAAAGRKLRRRKIAAAFKAAGFGED